MAGNYRYLDFEDRKKIEAWHARGDRPLEIAARLGVHTATIYHELQRGYCHPYSSFERGSNENQNRMIRRRYPKGTDFGKVSTAAIKDLEQWINNYPREILGWKTSAMCFRECLDAL